MVGKVILFLFSALIFCGCRSDISYQNRAIDRARSYLLKNCENLTSDEMYFIRYNSPYLLHAPLLGGKRERTPEKLQSELKQICVAWLLPGKDDLYMVFGVSSGRMDYWYPERILIRNYKSPEFVVPAAAESARKYTQNNFFKEMDRKEINRVRFSFPALVRSKFELNYNVDGKLTDKEVAARKAKDNSLIQYSLVWKLDGRNLVFAGLAGKGMKNWSLKLADFMSDEELNKYVLHQVLAPEEALSPLPASETEVR